MKIKKLTCLFIVLLVSTSVQISFATEKRGAAGAEKKWTPKLTDRVTDLAEIFKSEQISRLIKELAEYEQETMHEINVLTVRSLHGESIEAFSLRVGKRWGLGLLDYDNGILVTLAMSERKIRIELGKGMEKYISDETAGEIIQRDFVPFFRQSKYYEGVQAGLASLMKEARKYRIPKK